MENKQYKTKDLGEASALYTKGFKLLYLEKESNFYWFVFDNSNQELEQISNKYWSGELVISAKEYNDSMRSLKDRLFAQR